MTQTTSTPRPGWLLDEVGWLLEPMIVRAGFAIKQSEYSEGGIFAKYVLRRSGEQR